MTPQDTTADVDPIDAIAAVWVSVIAMCEQREGKPDEERWIGMAAGLQLAVAAVSGIPAGTPLRCSDLIRAGGDIARARIEAIRDGS